MSSFHGFSGHIVFEFNKLVFIEFVEDKKKLVSVEHKKKIWSEGPYVYNFKKEEIIRNFGKLVSSSGILRV